MKTLSRYVRVLQWVGGRGGESFAARDLAEFLDQGAARDPENTRRRANRWIRALEMTGVIELAVPRFGKTPARYRALIRVEVL